jgi:hypothetical protein
MSDLGASLMNQGRCAEAKALVLEGYAGLRDRKHSFAAWSIHTLTEAEGRVVRLYEAWDKPEEVRAWKEKLGLADPSADVSARP